MNDKIKCLCSNCRKPFSEKAAREFRIAAETAIVMARMAAQQPKRETNF